MRGASSYRIYLDGGHVGTVNDQRDKIIAITNANRYKIIQFGFVFLKGIKVLTEIKLPPKLRLNDEVLVVIIKKYKDGIFKWLKSIVKNSKFLV